MIGRARSTRRALSPLATHTRHPLTAICVSQLKGAHRRALQWQRLLRRRRQQPRGLLLRHGRAPNVDATAAPEQVHDNDRTSGSLPRNQPAVSARGPICPPCRARADRQVHGGAFRRVVGLHGTTATTDRPADRVVLATTPTSTGEATTPTRGTQPHERRSARTATSTTPCVWLAAPTFDVIM